MVRKRYRKATNKGLREQIVNWKFIFPFLLLIGGAVLFFGSDLDPFATFNITDDAIFDINYNFAKVNGELIWSVQEDLSEFYESKLDNSKNMLNFDADRIGVLALPTDLTRATGLNPEIGVSFGTPRYLVKSGDNFVVSSNLEPYNTVTESGYDNIFYKVRFRFFVHTFSEVLKINDNVNYHTDSGHMIVADSLPTTKPQHLEIGWDVKTFLTDKYPDDTMFRLIDVSIAPEVDRIDYITHTLEVYTGAYASLTTYYDGYSEIPGDKYDMVHISNYNDIDIDFDLESMTPNVAPKVTDSTMNIILDVSSGAKYYETLDEKTWLLRDCRLFFDVDFDFQLIVNQYSNARWAGSFFNSIIAFIPQRMSSGAFDVDNVIMPILFMSITLLVMAGTAYILIQRKMVSGEGRRTAMVEEETAAFRERFRRLLDNSD